MKDLHNLASYLRLVRYKDPLLTRAFISFLKEQNLLYKFNHYIRCTSMASPDFMENMINDAFTWVTTDEGHGFWSRMDFEWRALYRKLYYTIVKNKR